MPQPPRSSVHLDVSPGEIRNSVPVDDDEPFRILVLGDFSGRASRKVHEKIGSRKPVEADRDNVEELMEWLKAELSLGGNSLEFDELDDFTPDRLYDRIPSFRALDEEKQRPVSSPTPARRAAAPAAGGGLLDSMLEEEPGEAARSFEQTADLADFLRKVTRDHLVPREDPRQKAHAAKLDMTASQAMRALLHQPAFQSLEAAWRALDLLVRRLETGENLKVFIVDVTLNELATDLEGAAKLFASKPWAVITGLYTFSQARLDCAVLRALGRAASAAGAPFVAEAIPPSAESTPDWAELRNSPEAHWIGLVCPRFLLRLPYGRSTSPIERFDFEEMPEHDHQAYLWGSPAVACAMLLAQSFTDAGWDFRPGRNRRIEGLPLHTYRQDGETLIQPCAEVLMSEKEAEFLGSNGVMALASLKEQDAALLVRFQSIAEPVAALAGRWRG